MYVPTALMSSKTMEQNYMSWVFTDYVCHLASRSVKALYLVKAGFGIQTPELLRLA